jgi:hypothetical protein
VPTALFIIEQEKQGHSSIFTLPDGRKVSAHEVPTGAMWRCRCHDGRGWEIALPHRDPDPEWSRFWCTLLGDEQNRRWDVSGEAPNITVSPSINCVELGGWHGFIQNGAITDGSFNT